MVDYKVTFLVPVEILVDVTAPDEDAAADEAWKRAEAHLGGIDGHLSVDGVRICGSLDGIGAETVKEES